MKKPSIPDNDFTKALKAAMRPDLVIERKSGDLMPSFRFDPETLSHSIHPIDYYQMLANYRPVVHVPDGWAYWFAIGRELT